MQKTFFVQPSLVYLLISQFKVSRRRYFMSYITENTYILIIYIIYINSNLYYIY